MRLSRMFRPDPGLLTEETVPVRRALFWIATWMVVLTGVALFFRYARHLTPLLD